MKLEVNEIFQDGMVLQRERNISVWGRGETGRKVRVEIQGQCAEDVIDEKGCFEVWLKPLMTSEAEEMKITDGESERTFREIAVGEVWLAGGQSNMEFWMRYEKHICDVRPVCTNPRVRFYDVPEIAYDGQREQFNYSRMAIWRRANPENIDYFSGVAYYFAAMLERELDVPVGVIGCNWGGTTTSVWMREESVRQVGNAWIRDHEKAKSGKDMKAYWERQKTLPDNDTGNPFENPWNNKFLPETPPAEEALSFIISAFQNGTMDGEHQALPPASFPGCLYEHMLKTLENCVFRGVLWYQGESDEPHADLYGIMLTRLIEDWRELFHDPGLPFLMVQLPGYDSWCGVPQTGYAQLRRMQKAVAEGMEQVYLTSISDAGEQLDIHPKDKKKPGERLCLLALGKVYGRSVLCEPPEVDEAHREGNRVVLHFKNAGGGLVLEGTRMNALTVESSRPYSVRVEGEQVILEFSEEPEPYLWIRHAVQQFYTVNLYNQSGIPAIPFEIRV